MFRKSTLILSELNPVSIDGHALPRVKITKSTLILTELNPISIGGHA